VKKSGREIMEILEAFDATGCAHSAAQLAGVDPKTVRRYVAKRDAGEPVDGPVQRPKLIDPFLPKIEELVEQSEGAVRADVLHERLVAMGFTGVARCAVIQCRRHGQGVELPECDPDQERRASSRGAPGPHGDPTTTRRRGRASGVHSLGHRWPRARTTSGNAGSARPASSRAGASGWHYRRSCRVHSERSHRGMTECVSFGIGSTALRSTVPCMGLGTLAATIGFMLVMAVAACGGNTLGTGDCSEGRHLDR
jgi:hypothetical protein